MTIGYWLVASGYWLLCWRMLGYWVYTPTFLRRSTYAIPHPKGETLRNDYPPMNIDWPTYRIPKTLSRCSEMEPPSDRNAFVWLAKMCLRVIPTVFDRTAWRARFLASMYAMLCSPLAVLLYTTEYLHDDLRAFCW